MIFKSLLLNFDIEDDVFNSIYPKSIRQLSELHWTPVEVARLAAYYLSDNSNRKVLDIGSGAGKFCLIGACLTKGYFYGVEQRESLVKLSQKIAKNHSIDRLEFIHANITEISFSNYEAFYFFNPFYENIERFSAIDDTVQLTEKLYFSYSEYVRKQLSKTPKGTRLVTYCSNWTEIPEGFDIKLTANNGKLNFWEKRY